jgi:hypothetical protein
MMAFGLPARTVPGMTATESVLVGVLGTVTGVAAGYGLLGWLTATTIAGVMPEIGVTAALSAGTMDRILFRRIRHRLEAEPGEPDRHEAIVPAGRTCSPCQAGPIGPEPAGRPGAVQELRSAVRGCAAARSLEAGTPPPRRDLVMPVTSPVSPPVHAAGSRRRASRLGYWIGGGLAGAACIGAAAWVVLAFLGLMNQVNGFQRMTVPGTAPSVCPGRAPACPISKDRAPLRRLASSVSR